MMSVLNDFKCLQINTMARLLINYNSCKIINQAKVNQQIIIKPVIDNVDFEQSQGDVNTFVKFLAKLPK